MQQINNFRAVLCFFKCLIPCFHFWQIYTSYSTIYYFDFTLLIIPDMFLLALCSRD